MVVQPPGTPKPTHSGPRRVSHATVPHVRAGVVRAERPLVFAPVAAPTTCAAKLKKLLPEGVEAHKAHKQPLPHAHHHALTPYTPTLRLPAQPRRCAFASALVPPDWTSEATTSSSNQYQATTTQLHCTFCTASQPNKDETYAFAASLSLSSPCLCSGGFLPGCPTRSDHHQPLPTRRGSNQKHTTPQ